MWWRALVAGQAGAGGVGPLGLARREGAAWVGLAGVLHLAVHRAVTVLHLLVPLLTRVLLSTLGPHVFLWSRKPVRVL